MHYYSTLLPYTTILLVHTRARARAQHSVRLVLRQSLPHQSVVVSLLDPHTTTRYVLRRGTRNNVNSYYYYNFVVSFVFVFVGEFPRVMEKKSSE